MLEMVQNNTLASPHLAAPRSSALAAKKRERSRDFLLCESCFWSASAMFSADSGSEDSCPMCGGAVSRMPVSTSERYTFSYDAKRGVELEFSRDDK